MVLLARSFNPNIHFLKTRTGHNQLISVNSYYHKAAKQLALDS